MMFFNIEMYEHIKSRLSEVLNDFHKTLEHVEFPWERNQSPIIVGIRGTMKSGKTSHMLVLAHELTSNGYDVLLLVPNVDVRGSKKSDLFIKKMNSVRSNYADDSKRGWGLNSKLRKDDDMSVYHISSDLKDSKNCVRPKVIQSKDGMSGLALSVGCLDDNFLNRLFRPQDADDFEGVQHLLESRKYDCRLGNGKKYVPRILLIDGFQFFTKSDVSSLIRVAYRKYHVHLVVSGLTSDFKQSPFGCYSKLIHLMMHDIMLYGVCASCNVGKAIYTKHHQPKIAYDDNCESPDVKSDVRSRMYYTVCNECYHLGK